jgi:hypothetical protein
MRMKRHDFGSWKNEKLKGVPLPGAISQDSMVLV